MKALTRSRSGLVAALAALLITPSGTPAPPTPTGVWALGQALPAGTPTGPVVAPGVMDLGPVGPCGDAFELVDTANRWWGCTHGPDPHPATDGHRHTHGTPASNTPRSDQGTPRAPATVPCTGDGTSGYRIRAAYLRASDGPDRYGTVVEDLRRYVAGASEVIRQSSQMHGRTLLPRWAHDSSCVPVIDNIVVPPEGDDSITETIAAMNNQGLLNKTTKWLVFVDANVYCGIASLAVDDNPGQENLSNGNHATSGTVARVDTGCWAGTVDGQDGTVAAHEVLHTLGAVQTSAPNATPGWHCTDENDVMCYADGTVSASAIRTVCPDKPRWFVDCGGDDYFRPTTPPPGSYLESHWNTANSRFLEPEQTYNPPPPNNPDPTSGSGGLAASPTGQVATWGTVINRGGVDHLSLNAGIVGAATTPDGQGYWLFAGDGGVFSFGTAGFHGSMGGRHLNAGIVGAATTPDGQGYWLFAGDGGVFSFGTAGFHGSMGGRHLNAAIVGGAATPDGQGYWLFASDGGVFSFGTAGFHGSMGGRHLNAAIVGGAATPDGQGYWLFASDGGVFSFGTARFHGSLSGTAELTRTRLTSVAPTLTGGGYWLGLADGTVVSAGDAVTWPAPGFSIRVITVRPQL